MKKINNVIKLLMMLIIAALFSADSYAFEAVEVTESWGLDMLSSSVEAGCKIKVECSPEGDLQAILLVKSELSGIREVDYVINTEGIEERCHYSVDEQGSLEADWKVLETAGEKLICLAKALPLQTFYNTSITLICKDLDEIVYRDYVELHPIEADIEEIILQEFYSSYAPDLESETELPAEEEPETQAEEMETELPAEEETETSVEETETALPAQEESETGAEKSETGLVSEEESVTSVEKAESENESVAEFEMSEESAAEETEAEQESWMEPEKVYYPVYVPASTGGSGSRIPNANNINSQKVTAETAEGDGESEEKIEIPEETEVTQTSDEDAEEKEERRINSEGSYYDISEIEHILGSYISNPIDIVVLENNMDKLIFDSIVVSISRNGETIELERDVDYTVKMIGTSEKRKIYRYRIRKEVFADDGAYRVFLHSEDESGNENYSEAKGLDIRFYVDATAPLIIDCSQEGSSDGAAELIIRDNTQIADVEIFAGDEKIAFDKDGDNYRFSCPEGKELSDIKVVASDTAGNSIEKNIIHKAQAAASMTEGRNSSILLILCIVILAAFPGLSVYRMLRKKQQKRTGEK